MPKQINYSTPYSKLPLSQLRELHQVDVLDATLELILRSPFGGEGFDVQEKNKTKTEVTAEEAVAAARKQLQHHPEHPILNFVIGRELSCKRRFNLKYQFNQQEILE